jgi:hypothetical protein
MYLPSLARSPISSGTITGLMSRHTALVPNRCYAHELLDRDGGPSSTFMTEQFYSSEMCKVTEDIAPVRRSLRGKYHENVLLGSSVTPSVES